MKFSIIIPIIKVNDYLKENIENILKLNYKNFEIIVFTDKKDLKNKFRKTKIISTGKIGPAQKRDLALKYAKGSILAFIDDDAYPDKNWLSNSLKHFKNKKIAVVGGPAITPEKNNFFQKLSGAALEFSIANYGVKNRYLSIGKSKEIEDWQTVNLLVKKNIFKKIGGFNNKYWPGEDSKFCLDIINAGYKIIYEPKSIVFHHRRKNIIKHFIQTGSYGLHRGHFAKIFPRTSFKVNYFIPSFFVIYLIIILFQKNILPNIIYYPFYLYIFLIFFESINTTAQWKNIFYIIFSPIIIFVTHIWYGIRFIQGFLSKKI